MSMISFKFSSTDQSGLPLGLTLSQNVLIARSPICVSIKKQGLKTYF